MKKSFEGKGVDPQSEAWAKSTAGTRWLSGKMILLAQTPAHRLQTYIHPAYAACEYKQKLNLFSFGGLRLPVSFTVIAPPVSVDQQGFCGDIHTLIEDCRRRRGLFLLLNVGAEAAHLQSGVAVGKTLPSCVFANSFETFAEYLGALRSGYRRRIRIALAKGMPLTVKAIDNAAFDDALYQLYLQVHDRSAFPLERLTIEFFRQCGCRIDVFYLRDVPLAFVMYEISGQTLNFIFGGMEYANRDKYDLYYGMLLHLVKTGIESGVGQINFGQTAEVAKCRIGCHLEERMMIAFGGNPLTTLLLRLFAPLLQNKQEHVKGKVFKVE